MTAHRVPQEEAVPQAGPDTTAGNPGFLEIWARSAPIRLAGYEDDLAEPHILPGID